MNPGHQDLRLFHQMLLRLRAVEDQRKKSDILYDYLHRHAFLEPYLRMAKDPEIDFRVSSRAVEIALATRDGKPLMRAVLRGPLELLYLFSAQRVDTCIRPFLWAAYLGTIPDASLRATANCILDRDLRAGLSWWAIDRALRLVGSKPLLS